MTISKAQLQTVVDGLPETIEMDELVYRIYLLQKIAQGEADIAAGRIRSHEEVGRMIKEWERR